MISSKAIYDAIFVEKVSVVFKCLAILHLHLALLASEPSDDHWLGQACHQAACQHSLQVVLHVPALLLHQVCHVNLSQSVGAAVNPLGEGAEIAGSKGCYFSSLHTPSRQAEVKGGVTTGHHLWGDQTNQDVCLYYKL